MGLILLVLVVAVGVALRRCIRPLMDLWKEVRIEIDCTGFSFFLFLLFFFLPFYNN